MTFENRIVFDLAEIKAVIFECKSCGARISLVPPIPTMPPQVCPTGHHWQWNVDTGYDSTGSPFRAFLSSLARLQDPLLGNNMGFRVLLEITGASAPASGDRA
jgi:hypothetical protein